MKGYLLLGEPRSGSSWLADLANRTEIMGNADEYLNPFEAHAPKINYNAQDFYEYVMRDSATSNGHFGIRIFSDHLKHIHDKYGYDFMQKCLRDHDVKVVLLRRRDRVRQAISYTRSVQTKSWRSFNKSKMTPEYDFRAICETYFNFGKSYAFWEDYLEALDIGYSTYFYEDLLHDPSAYLDSLVDFLDVKVTRPWTTRLEIQRDELTEEWYRKFKIDTEKYGVMDSIWASSKTSLIPKLVSKVFK